MERAYLFFCRFMVVLFTIYTVYPIPVKLYQERFHNDWVHTFFHFVTVLFAAYAAWGRSSILPAKLFTGGIGAIYFCLSIYGNFSPGLLLDTNFAIPLGFLDNFFHMAVAAPALTIVAMDITGWRPNFDISLKFPRFVRFIALVDKKLSGA